MRKVVKREVVLMMMLSLLLGSLPSFKDVFVKAADSDVIRNDETGIPDKVLYQMILKEVGKPLDMDSTFTEEEAQKVVVLFQNPVGGLYDSYRKEEDQIVSLQGIEKLTNLRMFWPARNKITDLKPLENLKNLTSLGLRYSYCLTSIEDLRNVTQLDHLELPSTVTDLSPVGEMTELICLELRNSGISTLPDLTRHTKLSGKYTHFEGNNLTKKELTTKLPKQLVEDKMWLKQTIGSQKYNVKKINKTLKVTSPKKVTKVTSNTKTITGKTGKNLWVGLCYHNGRTGREKLIEKVKADKNGVFKMKNLNLMKYRKKQLFLVSFYSNYHYWEETQIKRVTFKLKK